MLKNFPRQAGAEQVARTVLVHGAAVVEGYVLRDTVAQIRSEIEAHLPEAFVGQDPFAGFRTRRVGGLIIKSPTLRRLLTDPLILGACDRILLPHCSCYQLSQTQAIEVGQGECAQMLHQDDAIYPVPRPHAEFEVVFGLALTDFTDENGATRIAMGSHRWGPERVPHHTDTVPAAMTAGSVVLFLGSTWHGGGSNQTDKPRLGVFVKYCLGHLRQEENQFLIAPPHVANSLEPKLRALIGYRVCVPFLGGVLDGGIMDLFVNV